ncbi:MAG TPA: hypothetical protein VNA69_24250 [Thermoanaerobaculia bacterium]|nr:hypothetical protein [Thermoanaerobaculia bacterium]
MSRAFLATYRPLCGSPQGRAAIARHAIPPYVDASCRREPDLEARWPTISALCRGANFAPRLRPGDRVAYMTTIQHGAWRLSALLEVKERFETHKEAKAWHEARGLALPSNCMTRGNRPIPLDRTDGCGGCHSSRELAQRDAVYAERALRFGVMLLCKPLFIQLHSPPVISREDWIAWNGRVPVTRTPPQISERLWDRLTHLGYDCRKRTR